MISLGAKGMEGQAADMLQVLKQLLKKLLAGRPGYQCNHCGFMAKTLHWQCPGCKTWSSIKPVQGPSQY